MQVGDTIEGRYRIEKTLGAGGMGQVYLAADHMLEKRVAIKTLLPAVLADRRAAEQLKQEVRISQELRHPNICATYDLHPDPKWPFIVMEYVEGETLNNFVYRQPGHRCGEPQFLRLAHQVLDAVAHAHQAGVVHRDLKSQNIMVTREGAIRVMDFGIAANLKETQARTTGLPVSLSIHYASPEQINGGKPEPSMDLYSLGCIFYEMLSGNPPFIQGDILHQQLTRTPDALPGVSPALNDVILACLHKNPEQRPRSVASIQERFPVDRTVRIHPRPPEPRPEAPPASASRSQPESGDSGEAVSDKKEPRRKAPVSIAEQAEALRRKEEELVESIRQNLSEAEGLLERDEWDEAIRVVETVREIRPEFSESRELLERIRRTRSLSGELEKQFALVRDCIEAADWEQAKKLISAAGGRIDEHGLSGRFGELFKQTTEQLRIAEEAYIRQQERLARLRAAEAAKAEIERLLELEDWAGAARALETSAGTLAELECGQYSKRIEDGLACSRLCAEAEEALTREDGQEAVRICEAALEIRPGSPTAVALRQHARNLIRWYAELEQYVARSTGYVEETNWDQATETLSLAETFASEHDLGGQAKAMIGQATEHIEHSREAHRREQERLAREHEAAEAAGAELEKLLAAEDWDGAAKVLENSGRTLSDLERRQYSARIEAGRECCRLCTEAEEALAREEGQEALRLADVALGVCPRDATALALRQHALTLMEQYAQLEHQLGQVHGYIEAARWDLAEETLTAAAFASEHELGVRAGTMIKQVTDRLHNARATYEREQERIRLGRQRELAKAKLHELIRGRKWREAARALDDSTELLPEDGRKSFESRIEQGRHWSRLCSEAESELEQKKYSGALAVFRDAEQIMPTEEVGARIIELEGVVSGIEEIERIRLAEEETNWEKLAEIYAAVYSATHDPAFEEGARDVHEELECRKLVRDAETKVSKDNFSGAIESYKEAHRIRDREEYVIRMEEIRGAQEEWQRLSDADRLVQHAGEAIARRDPHTALAVLEKAKGASDDRKVKELREQATRLLEWEELVEAGNELAGSQEWKTAREKFEAARTLYATPELEKVLRTIDAEIVTLEAPDKLDSARLTSDWAAIRSLIQALPPFAYGRDKVKGAVDHALSEYRSYLDERQRRLNRNTLIAES